MELVTALFRNRHPRAFAALFIAAVGLGFVGLLALQVLVPLVLGPAGLLLIVSFDLSLILAFHHAHRHPARPRYPHVTFGPVDKRYRARRRDAVESDFVATYAVIVFLLLLYAVGVALRVEYLAVDSDFALYLAGGVITTIADLLLAPYWGQFVPWGYWALQSESELFDTVEDH